MALLLAAVATTRREGRPPGSNRSAMRRVITGKRASTMLRSRQAVRGQERSLHRNEVSWATKSNNKLRVDRSLGLIYWSNDKIHQIIPRTRIKRRRACRRQGRVAWRTVLSSGVAVPNGSSITAEAYRDALSQGDVAMASRPVRSIVTRRTLEEDWTQLQPTPA
jgi:hypothetical protein